MNNWTLHRGDCVDYLPRYEGQADLILTSPPYDNLRDYGGHGFDFDRVANACVAALKPGGVIVWVVADATIDGSETGTSFRQALGFMERGLKLHDTMIYLKNGSGWKSYKKRHVNAFEYMFVLANGYPNTVNVIKDVIAKKPGKATAPSSAIRESNGSIGGRQDKIVPAIIPRTNVWQYSHGKGSSAESPVAHKHPAIYPLQLAKDHMQTWTNPGDLVIDPMAGSGTTMRAAVDLGRRAVCMEIHEPYCDLIEQRMAQQALEIGE